MMKINYLGLFDSIDLKASDALTPLLEMISNSIQSIEDLQRDDGKIFVEVLRNNDPSILDVKKGEGDITGFKVTDNGEGFTQRNFEAFNELYTKNKVERGGKGYGRLTWLSVFQLAEINSIYKDGESFKRRHFKFIRSEDPLFLCDDNGEIVDSVTEAATEITLRGIRCTERDKYGALRKKKLDKIEKEIIVRFFPQFHNKKFPSILLRDNSDEISLKKSWESSVEICGREDFMIDGIPFTIQHLKIQPLFGDNQKIYLCGNDMVVSSFPIHDYVKTMPKRIEDNEKEYLYSAYVSSSYLDSCINNQRTELLIPEEFEKNAITEGNLDMKTIRNGIIERCNSFLEPYLSPLKSRRKEGFDRFVKENPEFSKIAKYAEPRLDEMNYDCTASDIRKLFHSVTFSLEETIPSWNSLEKNYDENLDIDKFNENFDETLHRIDDLQGFNLTKYILRRRFILSALKSFLGKSDADKKYKKEDMIHKLIFPMQKTTNEVSVGETNIWLIDEKLIPYRFIASDKRLSQIQDLEIESPDRPDLIAFQESYAFILGNESDRHDSVVIVEFKRPMRNDYKKGDPASDPYEQVLGYVSKIRENKALTKSNRQFNISELSRFYCYIIADVTESLSTILESNNFLQTADGRGYYCYHWNFKSYFEVIPYDKLLTDAEKRNMTFFEKLGIDNDFFTNF